MELRHLQLNMHKNECGLQLRVMIYWLNLLFLRFLLFLQLIFGKYQSHS